MEFSPRPVLLRALRSAAWGGVTELRRGCSPAARWQLREAPAAPLGGATSDFRAVPGRYVYSEVTAASDIVKQQMAPLPHGSSPAGPVAALVAVHTSSFREGLGDILFVTIP